MIYQDVLDSDALEQYASSLNARAKRSSARGRLSADGLRDRILASGGRCEWCAENLFESEFELDHIASLHQGGANSAANLVVSCPDCNRRKGRKHPARFAAEILNKTGRKTELIMRVFRHYGVESAQQMSLFPGETQGPARQVDIDAESIEVPPYSWSE